ncbi:MAG: radical SAM family heme chaperone HemW [Clostridia bacterium]|nr:radical SAM family heme chaperone HemW [Clostridia bacterium]
MTNNISLYFHIPFCVRKCDYCAFYSLPDQGDEIKQDYFKALQRQIDFFETDKTVSTVYFGGGTPPMLGIERLCGLILQIKSKFTLATDCEITVEVNPGTVDFYDLKRLKEAGVNRLSVGIQAANDGVLRAIGRIHSFEQAKNCILDARKAGFDNLSGDIIFALPNQSLEEFCRGVNDIIATGLDHISAYSLQIEEGTAIYKRQNELQLPDEDGEEAQYTALCGILAENGYEHYEISNFARRGKNSRHNGNYWDCGEYFGFGAAAHSYYNGKRFSGVCNVKEFIERSFVSALAPTDYDNAEYISAEEVEEERIMLGLRTSKGARIPESKHSVARRIADLGYGCFNDGVLTLNSKGFRVSNEIIGEILV